MVMASSISLIASLREGQDRHCTVMSDMVTSYSGGA